MGSLFLPPRPFNLPAEFADNGSHSRARRLCRKAFLNNFLLIFTAHFVRLLICITDLITDLKGKQGKSVIGGEKLCWSVFHAFLQNEETDERI